MKRLIIVLLLCSNTLFAKYEVYLLIWRNEQTETGAGHCALAFKRANGYQYFTHYPKSGGGSYVAQLSSYQEVLQYDSAQLHIQQQSPNLVLSFQEDSITYHKMLKKANQLANKNWTLFNLNCADFAKKVFRRGKYDTGLAFLISTPLELVKDIRDHNIHHFKAGRITSRKGIVYHFLKRQPLTIPFVLKKWWNK